MPLFIAADLISVRRVQGSFVLLVIRFGYRF